MGEWYSYKGELCPFAFGMNEMPKFSSLYSMLCFFLSSLSFVSHFVMQVYSPLDRRTSRHPIINAAFIFITHSSHLLPRGDCGGREKGIAMIVITLLCVEKKGEVPCRGHDDGNE